MPDKSLNNGYLRTGHLIKENCNNLSDDTTNIIPLLNDELTLTTSSIIPSRQLTMTTFTNNTINNGPSHLTAASAATTNNINNNNKSATIVHFGPGSNIPKTSIQRKRNFTTSNDYLFKEPKLRKRLFILAIAFIVFGAGIGALTIYFVGNFKCITDDKSGKY